MSGFIGSAKLNCIYRFDGFDSPTFGDQSNFFYEPLHLFSIALNILVLSGPEKKPSFLFCFHTFLFFFFIETDSQDSFDGTDGYLLIYFFFIATGFVFLFFLFLFWSRFFFSKNVQRRYEKRHEKSRKKSPRRSIFICFSNFLQCGFVFVFF